MRTKKSDKVLEVKDLQVKYKQNNSSAIILKNLAFEMKKGEIVALLGESGSGKSTIAKAITGLLPPSAHIGSGILQLGSGFTADLAGKGIEWNLVRGKQLALLFQDAQLALNPVLKIKENFKEVLLYHNMASAEEVMPITNKLLSMLNFSDTESVLERYPYQLSGGMCQRICLALALCLKPAVLIADEPTSALDTVSQREVLDLLKRMQEEFGLTVLLITHDIAVANAISNRVIVLNRGAIEEEGDTKQVFSDPQAAYTRHLLASRSRLTQTSPTDRVLPRNQPLLEISGLKKTFKERSVLQDVNLTLAEGEIVGILGQSGCGKSTLARCLTGLEKPSGGRILYRGTEISRLRGKARREICKHIQFVFQDARASLNPRRTALQLVQEPLQYLQIGESKEREMRARFYLREVGIHDEAQHRRPPQLSSGQCQRIAIARALVLEPDILICDEAVSALDMSVQAQILHLLQRLNKQFGFSILMISHDIRVLHSFCHQIAVMHNGSFCEIKPVAHLYESEQPYTQLLLQCANDMEEGLLEQSRVHYVTAGGTGTYDS
ncbi:glutathione ABC transporter ATP-binding protein [Paenibacillus sp. FSL H8-0548]|uniref:ABC transporter ATP-binding protein n=1 Tax=Paenibacillus sp. FSL H8-0548 TaxID=1920422 RepID=UPI00096D84E5|nr:ABC transporter ATP-binding protein [Paenibacillus sp. FSL H8-0548]OMF26282.1 glutathione ABC transporter ATP-binding protein [Paenibacillus sp. FSL H8-0548]